MGKNSYAMESFGELMENEECNENNKQIKIKIINTDRYKYTEEDLKKLGFTVINFVGSEDDIRSAIIKYNRCVFLLNITTEGQLIMKQLYDSLGDSMFR